MDNLKYYYFALDDVELQDVVGGKPGFFKTVGACAGGAVIGVYGGVGGMVVGCVGSAATSLFT